MSKRQDGFRPSVINPAEFEFVAHHYLGPIGESMMESGICEEMAEQQERLEEHQAAHAGFTVAGHKWPGQCDCCGARYLWGATFHTATTNTYISIGGICADKMRLGSPSAMKTFREQVNTWKIHNERVAKARAYLTTVGLIAMLDLFLSKDNSREFPEVTLRDMCSKVIGWGNELSDKQQAFAHKLLQQITDRPKMLAEREARDAARQPVPVTDKRLTVKGTIISAEYREGGYSSQGFYQPSCVKIVVEATEGYKVWGTAAGELTDAVLEFSDKSYLGGDEQATLLKGKRVQFDARLTPSDKDTKFGFFKRPTKARILDVAPAKASQPATPYSSESLPA